MNLKKLMLTDGWGGYYLIPKSKFFSKKHTKFYYEDALHNPKIYKKKLKKTKTFERRI